MSYERFYVVLTIAFGFLAVISALMFAWTRFVAWYRGRVVGPMPLSPRLPQVGDVITLRSKVFPTPEEVDEWANGDFAKRRTSDPKLPAA